MTKGPGFIKRLKESWICLKKGSPGSRFLDCFRYKKELRRKHGSIYRWADIGLGASIALFGLVMVPLPGPGWIIVFFGMAMLAGESERIARGMDVGEQSLRKLRMKAKRFWRRASTFVKSSVALGASAIATALGYGVYCYLQAALG